MTNKTLSTTIYLSTKFDGEIPLFVTIGSSLISIIIILVNASLLLALWRNSSACKKRPGTIYLVALINCHLIVGIACFAILPGLVVVNASYKEITFVYELGGYFFRFILAVIYCLLVAILVDRMMAVKKPFLYQHFTWIQAVKTLPLTLIFPCVYLAILLINFKETSMTCVFLYTATGAFLVIGNGVIFMEVKNQLNQIKALTHVSPKNINNNNIIKDGGVTAGSCGIQEKLFKRKLKKSIFVSFLFAFTFILCWTPFSLVTIINVINGVYEGRILDNQNIWLINSLLILGFTNSFIDPVVYVLLNRPVRKAILRTIKCFKTNKEGNFSTSKITSNSQTI